MVSDVPASKNDFCLWERNKKVLAVIAGNSCQKGLKKCK